MGMDKTVTYPVNLCLDKLPVLVIGGGKVALRKVRGLLDSGAIVTVVAPEVVPELTKMAGEGRIELFQRPYETGEATEYRLVISATGDDRVDWQVSYDAALASVFVNVADAPKRCNFYLPAVVRRGNLQISINSGGVAPFASRRLRERLDRWFGEEFTSWIETAGAFRKAVLGSGADVATREALFDRFFAETLPALESDINPLLAPLILPEAAWRSWITEATQGDRHIEGESHDGTA